MRLAYAYPNACGVSCSCASLVANACASIRPLARRGVYPRDNPNSRAHAYPYPRANRNRDTRARPYPNADPNARANAYADARRNSYSCLNFYARADADPCPRLRSGRRRRGGLHL